MFETGRPSFTQALVYSFYQYFTEIGLYPMDKKFHRNQSACYCLEDEIATSSFSYFQLQPIVWYQHIVEKKSPFRFQVSKDVLPAR